MSEFKVDKIGQYKTRAGNVIRVICVDDKHEKPVIAVGDGVIKRYHLDGCRHSRLLPSDRDIIAHYTEPVVGSAEWAEALPEGTKVRKLSWIDGTPWVVKRDGKWYFWHFYEKREKEYGALRADALDWVLYTEPKFRAWELQEAPIGATLRRKGDVDGNFGRFMITYVDAGGVPIPTHDKHAWTKFNQLLEYYEHSTDGGKTWYPCGVLQS